MLIHHLRMALRVLTRNRLYTAINVTGLSVAVAFAVLALMFAHRELTMDTFHDKTDRLHRVVQIQGEPAEHRATAYTSAPLGPALKASVPDVVHVTRVRSSGTVAQVGEAAPQRTRLSFVDPDFLRMFSFPLAQGDAETALDDPFSIVLAEPTALRLFGTTDVVGRTARLFLTDDYADFTVAGVLEPVQGATDFRVDVLAPFATPAADHAEDMTRWHTTFAFTYVELAEDVEADAVVPTMAPIAQDHLQGIRDHSIDLTLQPLSDTYLNEEIEGGQTSPVFAYVFSASAALVLLIACVNFTNLSIGMSGARAKEVAVRKTSGAGRGRMMGQFWWESLVLCLSAVGLGTVLAWLFLPAFNSLLYRPLQFALRPDLVTGLLGLVLLTALLAGSYPAVVLSRLPPALVVRQSAPLGNRWLARGLVGFQFAVSILLLVVVTVLRSQVNYLGDKELGFRGDQVLSIWTHASDADVAGSWDLVERFRTEAEQIPGVTGVSASAVSATSTRRADILGEHHHILPVGRDYVETLGLTMAEGRTFLVGSDADIHGATIINQTAARHFRLQVGDRIEGFGREPVVVGILEDYHFEPPYTVIQPMFLFRGDPYAMRNIVVRIAPDNVEATVSALQDAWLAVAPGLVLEMDFADEEYAWAYQEFDQFVGFVGLAAMLAISLAAMGVFGLASLAVARRTKEVGIRKVLGATTLMVLRLFNREVTVLVLAASLVAAPLAWMVADTMLADWPYRIDLGPEYFLLGIGGVLALAWLTVSAQALRAALANPVDSLRYE